MIAGGGLGMTTFFAALQRRGLCRAAAMLRAFVLPALLSVTPEASAAVALDAHPIVRGYLPSTLAGGSARPALGVQAFAPLSLRGSLDQTVLAARPGRLALDASPPLSGSSPRAQATAQTLGTLVRPSARAMRISPMEAPVIDGDVSDPVWAKAEVIDNFIQKAPNPGQPATERTEVRILYDNDNLYIGFYNFDSNPSAIIATAMERDGQLQAADSVALYIDPGQTRRNAYNFEVGASGGRADQLELNNTQELDQWNTIWAARAKRVSDGWTAEISIPFRDLSFEPGQTTWGFDVSRRIRHKNERVYWSGWAPTLQFSDVSQSGNLAGIENVSQGLGLDIQIYGRLQAQHNWQKRGDGAGLSFTGGGNAFYKVTPALTDTLTVNPDFSDAPLDVRQVNTTRFSLFTPETRAFFLQDVAAFEFGGHNFRRDTQDNASNNARPFFSRNLGLVKGVPVSLRIGDKLSGQFAGFDIGALTVLTDNTADAAGQLLSVVRVTHEVLSESRFGFIVTNGDPTGLSNNTVAGLDYQYRDSKFLGRYILQSDGYVMKSMSSTKGDDTSAALSLNFPNEPWGGDVIVKQVGANFAPALGFVNRPDIRSYQGTVLHLDRFRGRYLNQLEFGSDFLFVTDLEDRLVSRENNLYARAASTIGDELTVRIVNDAERVPATFFLPNAVPIVPGSYDWNNVETRITTFNGRPIVATFNMICCSFYNGSAIHPRLSLTYRPNAYFQLAPTYDLNMIDLPTGKVNIHIVSVDGIVNFVPDMQMSLQLQYDNISGGVGFSARYRWEYQPGNELFVSVGQAGQYLNNRFYPQTSLLAVRLGQTFRF